MCYMFYGCESLISLPDISKWNTENVNNMSFMFRGCKSLISLSDISNWYHVQIKNIDYMIDECFSLLSIPSILEKNTNKSKTNKDDMSYMAPSSKNNHFQHLLSIINDESSIEENSFEEDE